MRELHWLVIIPGFLIKHGIKNTQTNPCVQKFQSLPECAPYKTVYVYEIVIHAKHCPANDHYIRQNVPESSEAAVFKGVEDKDVDTWDNVLWKGGDFNKKLKSGSRKISYRSSLPLSTELCTTLFEWNGWLILRNSGWIRCIKSPILQNGEGIVIKEGRIVQPVTLNHESKPPKTKEARKEEEKENRKGIRNEGRLCLSQR